MNELKTHPKIDYFLETVDRRSCPEYYEKIKEPMDLLTIEKKLQNGDYESGYQFALDTRLI